MNLAVLSLIVFLITVVVGIVRKVNCGLAAILASFILILFLFPRWTWLISIVWGGQ